MLAKGSTKNKIVDMPDKYYSDIVEKDMLHAVLLRSSIARGKIIAITVPDLPDSYVFFSASDIPGENTVEIFNKPLSVFAHDVVDYFGQPLGILAGPDESVLHTLLAQIEVSYAPYDPYVFSDALSHDQILAHRCTLTGDVDSAFEHAQQQFENTYQIVVPSFFFETSGAVVYWQNKTLQIVIPTQGSTQLKKLISCVINVPENTIEIYKTHIEKQNTNIWLTGITAAQAALVSILTKKTVKIVFSREEHQNYVIKNYPAFIRHRTALDENNRIIAMNIRILLNAGFFNPFLETILDRLIVASTGIYVSENFCVDVYAEKTSEPPANIDVRLCDLQLFFALETHINAIIDQLHDNPVDFRIKNSIMQPEVYKKSKYQFDFKNLFPLIQKASVASSFLRKYTAYTVLARTQEHSYEQSMRGIGMAIAYEGNAFLSFFHTKKNYAVEMILESNGTLIINNRSGNKKLRKIWMQLVSNQLRIPVENIVFTESDTEKIDINNPNFFSSNVSVITQLLMKCCASIQKARFHQPLPIRVKKVFSPLDKGKWDSEKISGTPFYSMSWAVCIVEVEIDPVLFSPSIRKIWFNLDAGSILDKKVAISAVKKSAEHLLSSLIESDVLDSPNIQVDFIESDENPKEIGDIVSYVLPPAFASAIAQVLGCNIASLPLKADTIYLGMQKEKSKGKK